MKRFIALSFAIALFSVKSFAQGEIPVDMYTGTPIIQVPLYTVKAQDISEPISLSYLAKGIKLEQSDGWYGLGWSLRGGGAISREVRGLPDDFGYNDTRKGWLYPSNGELMACEDIGAFSNSADMSAATCDEATDFNKLSTLAYLTDTEPDIFNYNFGGYSGSFVFDNTGVIRMIPFQDFKIEWVANGGSDKKIKSFKITTNDGNVYTFSRAVSTTKKATKFEYLNKVNILTADYEYYKTDVVYHSAWQLTRIDSPSKAWIRFSYTSDSYTSQQPVRVGVYVAPALGGTDLQLRDLYTMQENSSTQYLAGIGSSSGDSLVFQNYDHAVQKIIINDMRRPNGMYVKEFGFKYQDYQNKFLESITERSGCDIMPPYKFEYIGAEDLDNYNSNSKDFWGYFNSAPNSSLVPKLYIYPAEPPKDRYRLHPIPSYSGQEIILNGADRTPNGAAMQVGTLNRITFPAGGYATMDYEPNQYFDSRTGLSYTGGGLRVASTTYFDGVRASSQITKTFVYKDASNNSSGHLISRPSFALPAYKWKDPNHYNSTLTDYDRSYAQLTGNDQWKFLTLRSELDLSSRQDTHGSEVGYQFVTVNRSGAGSVQFEYEVPGQYGQETSGSFSVTRNKLARPAACPAVGVGDPGGDVGWSFPFSPNAETDYERGLLKYKTEYAEDHSKVRYTQYEYQPLYGSGSAPITVYGLHYDNYALSRDDDNNTGYKIFFYGKYALLANTDRVLKKETVTLYDPANETKSILTSSEYFYESTYHRLLTRVKETHEDGNIYTTKLKYAPDYGVIPNNADAASLSLRDLQSSRRYGSPIEIYKSVQRSGDTDKVYQGSLTRYENVAPYGPLPKEILALQVVSPLTSFAESSVQLQSGTYQLTPDTRYETVSTLSDYASFGQPITVTGMSRNPVSAVWGYSASLPVAQVSNARYGEFAFSDFETSTASEFAVTSPVYGAGRTGAKAMYPYTALSKTITKATGSNSYILSLWIKKKVNPVTIRVTVTNGGTYDNTFTFTPSGSDFEYFRKVIPTAGFASTFTVTIQGTSLSPPPPDPDETLLPLIDEVAFYPEVAELTSFAYAIPYGTKVVTSNNGVSSYTEYDKLGRVTLLRDKDKNIRQRNSYTFTTTGITVLADFIAPEVVFKNSAATFVAEANSCITGVTYEWVFEGEPFTTGSITQTHTYANTGYYNATLRVSHPQYGTASITKLVRVIVQPVAIDICAKGVREYFANDNLIIASYACGAITDNPQTSYGVIFKATTSESIGLTYQWKVRDVGATVWTNVGTNTSQYSIPKVLSTMVSFEVMCDVTDTTPGSGRTGHTGIMTVTIDHI